jgi:ubiquinone biosynthesis protein
MRASPARVVRFVGESQLRYRVQPKPAFGRWMRTELIRLGPAFIKLGQFLSTRPDILGKEVTNELVLLQDSIPNTTFEDIKTVIEASLAKPFDEVFVDFDKTAIASASIGQVHIATLKKNNRRVAVKIQKPNVAQLIQDDLTTLKKLNDIMVRLKFSQSKEVDRILTQYERFLAGELDYLLELEQMRRFKQLLSSQPVYIPGVYASLSTRQVLVMEYVDSIKITEIDKLKKTNIDTVQIARKLSNLFVYQMINSGYIHCDPHPGNLGVKIIDNEPTIVLYDFGNVVQFSKQFRMSIAEIIFAVYQKDINEFVDLLVKLNVIELENEDDIYEIKEFFTYFFKYLESLDLTALKSRIASGEITGSFKDNIKINPDFLSLFRIFSLLDGTCSLLDKNFNYIALLQPYTEEMMQDVAFIDMRARKDVEKLRGYPSMVTTTNGNVTRTIKKVNVLNSRLQQTQMLIGACIVLHDKVDVLYLISAFMLYAVWTFYSSPDKN